MKATEKGNLNENLSIHIWKLSIGSTLSWELSKMLGSVHPYLAPLTVILTLQTTIDKTVSVSITRLIGTILGIIVTVLFASNITINGWRLGVLMFLGCFIAKFLKFDKKVINQVALTILLVFLFGQSIHYPLDRIRDTLVGAIVACSIQLAWFGFVSKKNVAKS
jgi:uncharacterized membrane protein YgaE (UPF0421/DUF939 family)